MIDVAIARSASYTSADVNKALDRLMEHLGYSIENPFSVFIHPGMNVFIKPNWVASRWRASCTHEDTLYCVITHPVVIEAVADRVALALNGRGSITIGDNPSIDADFDELMTVTDIKRLEHKYDVPCNILDLRPLVCKDLRDYGQRDKMHQRKGDPKGEIEINLGDESLLYTIDPSLFRGVFDERAETVLAHTGDNQLYTFSRSLYDADVYISIPKLKTHHKAGVTLNLKGLVGSIANKNQLVHWRVGTPENGGDEYPGQASYEAGRKAKVTHRGAHPGNDTIWRMVVDLYKAFMKKERQYFTVIDGVIAGEGSGPFCPTAKNAGVLLASNDLLAADIAATTLMGINPRKVKYLDHFMANGYISMENIAILSDFLASDDFFKKRSSPFDFILPAGWEYMKLGWNG